MDSTIARDRFETDLLSDFKTVRSTSAPEPDLTTFGLSKEIYWELLILLTDKIKRH